MRDFECLDNKAGHETAVQNITVDRIHCLTSCIVHVLLTVVQLAAIKCQKLNAQKVTGTEQHQLLCFVLLLLINHRVRCLK